MTRLLWFFGWVGVAIWSLVCAAAYGFFDLVGRLFMRNADAFSSSPETVEGLWRFFNILHGFSTGAVLVAWAIVSLLILAVPWAFARLSGSGSVRYTRVAVPMPSSPFSERFTPAPDPTRYPGPKGVIELGPDQYSVGPARTSGDPGARGSVPPIPPRA